jgi:hypothetical protein
MSKFYNIAPKNVLKPKILFGFVSKRLHNTYHYNQPPKCEICNDFLFYTVGMFIGFFIGKNTKK